MMVCTYLIKYCSNSIDIYIVALWTREPSTAPFVLPGLGCSVYWAFDSSVCLFAHWSTRLARLQFRTRGNRKADPVSSPSCPSRLKYNIVTRSIKTHLAFSPPARCRHYHVIDRFICLNSTNFPVMVSHIYCCGGRGAFWLSNVSDDILCKKVSSFSMPFKLGSRACK